MFCVTDATKTKKKLVTLPFGLIAHAWPVPLSLSILPNRTRN